MSWKISVGKVDINDHVAVTAWLVSVLLFPIFCTALPPGHILKPTFHFITALLGAFFRGRESLKGNAKKHSYIYASMYTQLLMEVLHCQYRLLFQDKSFSGTALLEPLKRGLNHNFMKTR